MIGVFSVVGGVAVIVVIVVVAVGREISGVSLEELNEKQLVEQQAIAR